MYPGASLSDLCHDSQLASVLCICALYLCFISVLCICALHLCLGPSWPLLTILRYIQLPVYQVVWNLDGFVTSCIQGGDGMAICIQQ